MGFNEYEYKRPDIEKFKSTLTKLIKEFKEANDAQTQIKVINKINKEINHFDTMASIASVRYTLNTQDEFYAKENDFFDENSPLCQAIVIEYYKALVNSKFKDELIQKYGQHLFNIASQALLTFDEKIIEELQEENRLTSEYTKLIASAKIKYKGKVYALTQLAPFAESKDRKERKTITKLTAKFFEENEKEIDRIYDGLVKVRDTMGKKMGFENYLPLGYLRMGRMDYDAKDVAIYRQQIENDVVPLAHKLIKKQFKRIGIRSPKNYDLALEFIDGNPSPKGSKDEMVEKALTMYKELSKETGEFFSYMIDNDLMDLEAKQGKRGGGYCTSFSDYKSPFIFANFTGTDGDVGVLTHEAGHAFQYFCSRNNKVPEYAWPTMEAAEIHSMSMEFFTWKWMELFFEEDADKYRYSHLCSAITFLPYGACVDHFQEWVYTNPNATPDERKTAWRDLEKRYTPWKKYDIEFLDKGTWWYRQSHIFLSALYYIDYTLAQVCALQFWGLDQKNHELAWKRYLKLCKLGGSYSFLELLNKSSLKNPFVDGTIKKTLVPVKKWLNNIDDKTYKTKVKEEKGRTK